MNEKNRRLSIIKDILERQRPRNQRDLLDMLSRVSIESTQATLSRDLRDLGVLKGPDGYELPRTTSAEYRDPTSNELRRALNAFGLAVKRAGSLVVIRTGPGQAAPLALEIDRSSIRDVIGTVAGDDTIFVATASPNKATRLVRTFEHMAR